MIPPEIENYKVVNPCKLRMSTRFDKVETIYHEEGMNTAEPLYSEFLDKCPGTSSTFSDLDYLFPAQLKLISVKDSSGNDVSDREMIV